MAAALPPIIYDQLRPVMRAQGTIAWFHPDKGGKKTLPHLGPASCQAGTSVGLGGQSNGENIPAREADDYILYNILLV